jgi:hypothetical protein
MSINSDNLEMLAALEEAGVEGSGAKRRCPMCGSSDGVSVSMRRSMAKCFACGVRFWPRKGYTQTWVSQAMQTLYTRFHGDLLACESPEAQKAMRYLVEERGIDRELIVCYETIGVVPLMYKPSGVIELAKDLREKEEEWMKVSVKRTANKKAKDDIEFELEENERIWERLMTGLDTLKISSGALAFFYVNSGFDFVSINLRNRNPEGDWKFRQVKPLLEKGVYSPIGPDDKAGSHYPTTTFDEVPGTCLLVEGEFNLLTFRSALKRLYSEDGEDWKEYLYASAALGSATTWDVRAARALFREDEIVINYDNDDPGREAIRKFTNSGKVLGFCVPLGGTSKKNDANWYIREHGILEYLTVWRDECETFYRPWESAKEELDGIRSQAVKKSEVFLVEREAIDFVEADLKENRGTLYVDQYRDEAFLHTHEGALVPIDDSKPFKMLLDKYGVEATHPLVKKLWTNIGLHADATAPTIQVRYVVDWDRKSRLHYDLGNDWMARIGPATPDGPAIDFVRNGIDSVFFGKTKRPEGEIINPETLTDLIPKINPTLGLQLTLGSDAIDLKLLWKRLEDDPSYNIARMIGSSSLLEAALFNNISFSTDYLTVRQAKQMALCHNFSLWLPSASNPSLLALGAHRGGKTSLERLMARIQEGTHVNVLDPSQESDDMQVVLGTTKNPILDNIDKEMDKKTIQTFMVACTGGGFKRRKKYSDKDTVQVEYECNLMTTARLMPNFKAPDMADRMIVISFEAGITDEANVGEDKTKMRTARLRPWLVAETLVRMSNMLRGLQGVKDGLTTRFRFADYSERFTRMARHEGWGGEAVAMFDAVQAAQAGISNTDEVRDALIALTLQQGHQGEMLPASAWKRLLAIQSEQHRIPCAWITDKFDQGAVSAFATRLVGAESCLEKTFGFVAGEKSKSHKEPRLYGFHPNLEQKAHIEKLADLHKAFELPEPSMADAVGR